VPGPVKGHWWRIRKRGSGKAIFHRNFTQGKILRGEKSGTRSRFDAQAGVKAFLSSRYKNNYTHYGTYDEGRKGWWRQRNPRGGEKGLLFSVQK